VNANHLTTFGADPFLFFIPNEMSDPKFIYHPEIVDHAHSILCSVSLVQIFQPDAGKSVTAVRTILELAPGDFFAVFDFTGGPGFWFLTIMNVDLSTARAGIFFPDVSPAEAAVHPAGGDQTGKSG
jgi:hypothetical protein